MNTQSALLVATHAVETFVHASQQGQGAVVVQPPMATLADRLDVERWLRDGGFDAAALGTFLTPYLAASTQLHHPAYMGHQVAVPVPMGAAAALVDAMTNNAMAIYEMGPAAATVEYAVIRWMLEKIGWQAAPMPAGSGRDEQRSPEVGGYAGGVLTHGGSLANLTAMAAARAAIAPTAWEEGTPQDLVVVAPKGCHYSVARAISLLGLGQAALIAAPTDDDGRMIPTALGGCLDQLQQQGKRVMAVIANAAATAAGLYDPIEAIATLCRARGVWLHIDGAHGASALVSQRYRALLRGIDLADSVVWDAHKMLRTPTLCAAVLVRRVESLEAAFQDEASYLFHDKDEPGIDLIHRTVECTKAGLGLKAFMTLAAQGEQGLADYVEGRTDLARDVASALSHRSGWEVAVEPQTNIVLFRPLDQRLESLEIRRGLLEDGRWYISSTEFKGKRWLRLALMNPLTTMKEVMALIQYIEACHPEVWATERLVGAAE